MLGTPTYSAAVPSVNGPLAETMFVVAVIAIGILAPIACAAPATEGPPGDSPPKSSRLEPRTRDVLV